MGKANMVRLSVDVTPDEHRQLIEAGNRLAADIQVPRVHNQEIMSSLLRLMLSDNTLTYRVQQEVTRRRVPRYDEATIVSATRAGAATFTSWNDPEEVVGPVRWRHAGPTEGEKRAPLPGDKCLVRWPVDGEEPVVLGWWDTVTVPGKLNLT